MGGRNGEMWFLVKPSGGQFEVTSGLKADEVIVIRGQDRLQDGMMVTPFAAASQDGASVPGRL